jgi:hypothetical protein
MSGEHDPMSGAEQTEEEMGAPLAELAEIAEPTSKGFFGRVRNSIDRRRLGSELADMSWFGVLSVFFEFLDMTVQMVTGGGKDEQRR